MLMDIFSSFDPQCYSSLLSSYFVWVSGLVLCMLMVNSNIWVSGGSIKMMTNKLVFLLFDQSNQTSVSRFSSGNTLIIGFFLFLVGLNFYGLLPYVFSPTSHLSFSFGVSFSVWLSMIISSFVFNFYNSVASLLPGGAPWWLNPFLVIIEFVSLSVRPLTLAFRLAANMTAGHIVLTLISEFMGGCLFSNFSGSVLLGLINSFYLMFEMGVSLIQAYIFCLLLTLYCNDHQ